MAIVSFVMSKRKFERIAQSKVRRLPHQPKPTYGREILLHPFGQLCRLGEALVPEHCEQVLK